jgi:hypothetical protein
MEQNKNKYIGRKVYLIFNSRNFAEFCLLFAVGLFARASLVFGTYLAMDDYLSAYERVDLMYCYISEGRFPVFLINKTLEILGAPMPFLGSFWTIFCVASYAATGVLLRKLLMPNACFFEAFVFGGLFSLFPYFTEIMTFHIATPFFSFALIFCGAFLYFTGFGWSITVIACLGLFFSVSYQIFIPYTFVGIIMLSLLRLGRNGVESLESVPKFFKFLKPSLTRFVLLGVCVVACGVLGKFVLEISGVTHGDRVTMVPFAEFPNQAVMLVKQLSYFLLRPETSIPLAVKIIQLSLLSLCLWGFVAKARLSDATFLKKGLFLAMPLGLIALALSATVGPFLLVETHSHGTISPRMLGGFAFFWAGIFAAAWSLNGGFLRKVTLGLGVVLCFSYAMISNQQSVDFARINLRDRVVSGMIVERLAGLEGFDKMRTVVFAGENERYILGKIDSNTAGFNVSALIRSHAFVPVLLEATGVEFELPKESDFERGEELALGKPVWPREGSVFIVGDLGVVVVGEVRGPSAED